ncbi:MAG: glycosyltransferase family 1 protein [Acidobacteriota bacterium]|nr:glycosyltransferase family 1 protein [Acidobacteriota bacterium]
MRVAIMTDNDFEKVNGVTTTLRAVLAHPVADVEPHIYTCSSARQDDSGYTAVAARSVPIPFYREMAMYAPPLREIRNRLLADRIELLHLTTPGPIGLLARYLAEDMNLPIVGSYHTELGEYTTRLSGSPTLGAAMQAYMRWVYGRCTRILVPSSTTRNQLEDHGWRSERLTVWSRGVDSTRFHPGRRSAQRRSAWGVSDTRPAILYAGRLSREKGLALFGPVVQLLRDYRMPHRFVLCGDGPMRDELRSLVPDAVFTGAVSHDAIGEIMASCDVLLFPSETDTAGNVVLEAQASGLPVLVADRGGPQENLLDRITGSVCAAGSERDFCLRLAELLVDRRRRQTMSLAARRYAESRGWRVALEPLFDAYRSAAVAERTAGTISSAGPAREAAHV